MPSKLAAIVIDANDVQRVAAFWGAVLGRAPEVDADGDVVLAAPQGESVDVLVLGVPDAKRSKNRLHLDLRGRGVDQDEELARLVALGATRVDIGQGDVSWVVLADPEGNEFCLLAGRAEEPGPAIGLA